jgi:hypothetical protein
MPYVNEDLTRYNLSAKYPDIQAQTQSLLVTLCSLHYASQSTQRAHGYP